MFILPVFVICLVLAVLSTSTVVPVMLTGQKPTFLKILKNQIGLESIDKTLWQGHTARIVREYDTFCHCDCYFCRSSLYGVQLIIKVVLGNVFAVSYYNNPIKPEVIMRRLLLLVLPCSILLAQNPRIPKDAMTGYKAITAKSLSARLHFIAAPELEGRETTFRGQKIAARYIASEFQRLGLKPIGDSGSYFQRFNVEATKVSETSHITVTNKSGRSSYSFRSDFLALSGRENEISGPVLFIGHMDTEVDSSLTKGRIVVALAGRREDARDTSVIPIRRVQSVRQFPGSLATLVIADDTGAGSVAQLNARFGQMIERGVMQVVGPQARAPRGSSFPVLIAPSLANAILSETGKSLAQLRAAAFEDAGFAPASLNQTSLSIDLRNAKELKTTENVIGFLEGSDPQLKQEVVVFTAHYDHIGVAANGNIYHGADDDGSGTVTVIELAQAFASNPVRPKRSLVFMTVVGEEKGLWGSDWYVKHPVIPLEKTIANINIDMIGRMDKKYEEMKNPDYVYVIGSDKISTQLDSVLKLSNKESENIVLDYTYNDDKDPNQFYRRSDHYNFAKNGVPIVFFFTGVHDDYHKVTDTVDKILFERMERIVRLIYHTGWKVANKKGGLAKNVGSTMFGK